MSIRFSVALGNPAYQLSRPDTKDAPVYNYFMDAAYGIADQTIMITPGRFLFNAGSTPKPWNEKMLNDEHFKVEQYEPDSKRIFPNADIKGGVAIHYYNNDRKVGPIGTFTTSPELNSIKDKVISASDFTGLDSIVYPESAWRISDTFRKEHPEEIEKLGASASRFFTTNCFDILSSSVLFEAKPEDEKEYIGLYGRSKNERVYRWIEARYVAAPDNKDYYKVFVPKSNGCGNVGELLSTPVIGAPVIGHTQTFISIGKFNIQKEAENCLKYIKGKFARAMLGILKVTQDNKRDVWRYVPLQDFTSSSDIDWSLSIPEIDKQLYQKYGLDEEETKFIESHVREMS